MRLPYGFYAETLNIIVDSGRGCYDPSPKTGSRSTCGKENRWRVSQGGNMKKPFAIAFTLMLLLAFKLQSQVEQPLKLIQSIPLPGLHDGDLDHFALDTAGHRLFLTAEDNSAVEVIDLRTHKVVQTIKGPKEPHSMAYRADLKELFVVDGDEEIGDVKIYQGDSYKSVGSIKLAANADSSAYDPSTKYMYVVNGGTGPPMTYAFISVI